MTRGAPRRNGAAPASRARTRLPRPLRWSSGDLVILDQTALPARAIHRRLSTTAQVCEAIARLRVRGAPLLGIAGAYGVAQAALRSRAASPGGVVRDAERAGARLAATRPTAVNLGWAIDRALERGRAAAESGRDVAAALLAEARAIEREDAAACEAMASHAQRFIGRGATVLTHCNTGALVTGGIGTALGAIRVAHERGKRIEVLATETRPLLQGARLTVWELARLGIPHALVADGAAAGLIARGDVSVVLVGADRIARNGDVANKVGTYPLALAAREAGIAFVVVAPDSTIDPSMPDGRGIVVEDRAAAEVVAVMGRATAPPGTPARNPAFDVTPARLVTAIVTQSGVRDPSGGRRGGSRRRK